MLDQGVYVVGGGEGGCVLDSISTFFDKMKNRRI